MPHQRLTPPTTTDKIWHHNLDQHEPPPAPQVTLFDHRGWVAWCICTRQVLLFVHLQQLSDELFSCLIYLTDYPGHPVRSSNWASCCRQCVTVVCRWSASESWSICCAAFLWLSLRLNSQRVCRSSSWGRATLVCCPEGIARHCGSWDGVTKMDPYRDLDLDIIASADLWKLFNALFGGSWAIVSYPFSAERLGQKQVISFHCASRFLFC